MYTNGQGLDPDPALFFGDFQDANKQCRFYTNYFCLLFMEGTVHLHQSSNITNYQEVTNLVKSSFFFFIFYLLMEGSGPYGGS